MSAIWLPSDDPLALAARGWPSPATEYNLASTVQLNRSHEIFKYDVVRLWVGHPQGMLDLITGHIQVPAAGIGTYINGGWQNPQGSAVHFYTNFLTDVYNDTGIISSFTISELVNPGTADYVSGCTFTENRPATYSSFPNAIGWQLAGSRTARVVAPERESIIYGSISPNAGDKIVHAGRTSHAGAGLGIPWSYVVSIGGNLIERYDDTSISNIYTACHKWLAIGDATSGGPVVNTKLAITARGSFPNRLLRDLVRNPFGLFEPANQAPYLISIPAASGAPTLSNATATSIGQTTATVGCTVTF